MERVIVILLFFSSSYGVEEKRNFFLLRSHVVKCYPSLIIYSIFTLETLFTKSQIESENFHAKNSQNREKPNIKLIELFHVVVCSLQLIYVSQIERERE
jgi:hypothetical protein